MKVSIIIPVFNVEKYITRCIQSVISQTYKGKIECIIIDDCTPDNSVAIVSQIIKEYKGNIIFSVIHHDKNKGLSAARNTGIKAATGDYIYFLDSDDEIHPSTIALMVEKVEKYPLVDFVVGDYKENLFPDKCHIDLPEIIEDSDEIFRRYLTFNIPATAWNKLIKRSFLLENNLFFKEGLIPEDIEQTFRLALHARKMACICKKTYIYYINNQSSISNNISKKNIFNIIAIRKEQIQLVSNLKFQPRDKNLISDFFMNDIFTVSRNISRCSRLNKNEKKVLLNELNQLNKEIPFKNNSLKCRIKSYINKLPTDIKLSILKRI
ncbi:glycosyltransferase family 2 protein [uncultured Phocaeicola sp.]|uniref:glycosyltransferase family 2 protein n=1 Tax=uncultured Phocaeicola sp. TaxID=990718 RepID=UPI0025EA87D5|nr:glycosyltransferase family 2 protein [uncultured Phocaeicola sp.]